MFCPSCGNENTAESRFCGKCGTPLTQAAPAEQQAPPAETVPMEQQAPQAETVPAEQQTMPMEHQVPQAEVPEADATPFAPETAPSESGDSPEASVSNVSRDPFESGVSSEASLPNASADAFPTADSPFPADESVEDSGLPAEKKAADDVPFKPAPPAASEEEPYQEITDTFARELPSWDLKPPATMVKRKKRR